MNEEINWDDFFEIRESGVGKTKLAIYGVTELAFQTERERSMTDVLREIIERSEVDWDWREVIVRDADEEEGPADFIITRGPEKILEGGVIPDGV